MEKKTMCMIGVVIVLLLCIIAFFKPPSFLDTIGENNRLDIILNAFEIEDGEPNIESLVYNDIAAEQKDTILAVLEKYDYRRTFGTLFSNGSITDLPDKTVTILVYDDNSSVATIVVAASGKIAVNNKSYGMEDAEQLIKQIIEIVE